MAFFDKIKEGLKKTKESAAGNINAVLANFREVDEDLLEELEDGLVMADIGASVAAEAIDELRREAKLKKLSGKEQVTDCLCRILASKMTENTGLRLS